MLNRHRATLLRYGFQPHRGQPHLLLLPATTRHQRLRAWLGEGTALDLREDGVALPHIEADAVTGTALVQVLTRIGVHPQPAKTI